MLVVGDSAFAQAFQKAYVIDLMGAQQSNLAQLLFSEIVGGGGGEVCFKAILGCGGSEI